MSQNQTAVVACKCQHPFQDATYGKGQRVTTPDNKAQSTGQFRVRCTVCSREHDLGPVRE